MQLRIVPAGHCTIKQLSERWGATYETVRTWVRRGALKRKARTGSRIYVPLRERDRFEMEHADLLKANYGFVRPDEQQGAA